MATTSKRGRLGPWIALCLILASAWLPAAGWADAPAPAASYAWPITSVMDGDTVRVDIPGLPPELKRLSVRLRGINAPETGGKAKCDAEKKLAARATAFLTAAITTAKAKRHSIRFTEIAWDKYGGRIDARLLINGQDIGPAMIAARLARAYDGGKREGWCP